MTTIEFLDSSDKVVGTITQTLTGIEATGAGRTVLEAAQQPSRFPPSDKRIIARYSEWSNGYMRSRLKGAA